MTSKTLLLLAAAAACGVGAAYSSYWLMAERAAKMKDAPVLAPKEGDIVDEEKEMPNEPIGTKAPAGVVVPAGYVGVSIDTNLEGIAAGGIVHHVGAGWRVNVICTERRNNDEDSFSKILLEDVLVLDSEIKTIHSDNGTAIPRNVVWVAVKAEDLRRFEHAKQSYTIGLALRSISKSDSGTITAEYLRGQR